MRGSSTSTFLPRRCPRAQRSRCGALFHPRDTHKLPAATPVAECGDSATPGLHRVQCVHEQLTRFIPAAALLRQAVYMGMQHARVVSVRDRHAPCVPDLAERDWPVVKAGQCGAHRGAESPAKHGSYPVMCVARPSITQSVAVSSHSFKLAMLMGDKDVKGWEALFQAQTDQFCCISALYLPASWSPCDPWKQGWSRKPWLPGPCTLGNAKSREKATGAQAAAFQCSSVTAQCGFC